MRFFNTEGPVNCADHYCLPPLARLADAPRWRLHELSRVGADVRMMLRPGG